jgi:hypothetical protein
MVHVSRGESVTFHLYSENNLSNAADTDAWHITVTDSFALLHIVALQGGSVGPNASDSFTYVAGSETATATDWNVWPDSIAYYVRASGTWTAWQTYSVRNETLVPGGAAAISGIKWQWDRISSKTVWDDVTQTNIPSNLAYKLHVQFSVLRKDN